MSSPFVFRLSERMGASFITIGLTAYTTALSYYFHTQVSIAVPATLAFTISVIVSFPLWIWSLIHIIRNHPDKITYVSFSLAMCGYVVTIIAGIVAIVTTPVPKIALDYYPCVLLPIQLVLLIVVGSYTWFRVKKWRRGNIEDISYDQL